MKIYTKTGDKGETSLYTGQRISKSDPIMDAIGTVDECNSALGFAISLLPPAPQYQPHRQHLEIIQHALFDLGAALATPRTRAPDSKIKRTRFDQEGAEMLEKWIDEMESELPPLRTFILPGGHAAGSALHLARSICRRAERLVLPINQHEDASDNILIYLNRLSDYLFVMARTINHLAGNPETLWEHNKKIEE